MEAFPQKNNSKTFFYLACAATVYFGFLLLNAYVTRFTSVLIGIFQELLTIPFIMLQLILLLMTFNNWRKESFQLHGYSFLAFLILITSSVVLVLLTVFA
jgi:hypothetical protein